MSRKIAKVLFVFTSQDRILSGRSTGWYLPEAAHPYQVLSPKVDIEFASPKGPNPPVDPRSVETFKDDESFLHDADVREKLQNAKKLSDVKASDYDAVFYVGGHGPVIDLASDPTKINLAADFNNQGKIILAICHGPAALVGVKDPQGKSIFAGKKAVSFTNEEEAQIGLTAPKDLPFLLETRIRKLGGEFISAEPWAAKVVEDGNLITGQNPASARPLGEALLRKLETKGC